jgi:hypothetical protein
MSDPNFLLPIGAMDQHNADLLVETTGPHGPVRVPTPSVATEDVEMVEEFDKVFEMLKDIPAVVEVQECIDCLSSGTPVQQKMMAENFFTLLCAYIGNDIAVDEDPSRHAALYDTAAIKMAELVVSLPLKEYFRDNLFAYLPGNTWPPSFLEFLKVISNKDPGIDFRKKHQDSGRSEQALRLRHYGYQIFTRYMGTKATVNTSLNPHWNKENLEKSGSTPSAVFHSIRKHCYENVFQGKGAAAVK